MFKKLFGKGKEVNKEIEICLKLLLSKFTVIYNVMYN